MTKMINQNNRTDQCPPRPQRNGTGHHREWTASRPRLAAHSSGVDGLEFIEGFMLPIAYEQDLLSEFISVRELPGCCYGFPPNPHEWVKGVVKAPKFRVEIDHPVRVHGVFHVGAERSGGYLSSIYRLDADAVADPPIK